MVYDKVKLVKLFRLEQQFSYLPNKNCSSYWFSLLLVFCFLFCFFDFLFSSFSSFTSRSFNIQSWKEQTWHFAKRNEKGKCKFAIQIFIKTRLFTLFTQIRWFTVTELYELANILTRFKFASLSSQKTSDLAENSELPKPNAKTQGPAKVQRENTDGCTHSAIEENYLGGFHLKYGL